MAAKDGKAPIIVKKVVKGGGGGHHGGAWKVAYADFVTAMMAFFLLMWLLNATTEKQRKGLADYFDPTVPISRVSSGGTGMLAGDEVMAEDTLAGNRKEGKRPQPTHLDTGPALGEETAVADKDGDDPFAEFLRAMPDPEGAPGWAAPGAGDAFAAAYQAEEDRLAALGAQIEAAMQAAGGEFTEHFQLRMTPDGLVIEIVDADDAPLFDSGSAAAGPLLTKLLEIIVPVLERALNNLAIVGHTDARPFGGGGNYTNWELSADRANTARRLLGRFGLAEHRVERVTGRAATELLSDDPFAAQNRRIAITLLRMVRR